MSGMSHICVQFLKCTNPTGPDCTDVDGIAWVVQSLLAQDAVVRVLLDNKVMAHLSNDVGMALGGPGPCGCTAGMALGCAAGNKVMALLSNDVGIALGCATGPTSLGAIVPKKAV